MVVEFPLSEHHAQRKGLENWASQAVHQRQPFSQQDGHDHSDEAYPESYYLPVQLLEELHERLERTIVNLECNRNLNCHH